MFKVMIKRTATSKAEVFVDGKNFKDALDLVDDIAHNYYETWITSR